MCSGVVSVTHESRQQDITSECSITTLTSIILWFVNLVNRLDEKRERERERVLYAYLSNAKMG